MELLRSTGSQRNQRAWHVADPHKYSKKCNTAHEGFQAGEPLEGH